MVSTTKSFNKTDADKALKIFFDISSAVHSTENLIDLYRTIKYVGDVEIFDIWNSDKEK
jgi:hypothetical protein